LAHSLVRRLGATDSGSPTDSTVRARWLCAQQALELGEDLLDGVQVGEYFGRKNNLAPSERMNARTGFIFLAAVIKTTALLYPR
jgi:hypothetical protein